MKKISIAILLLCSVWAGAQEKIEFLPYGNMDSWAVRYIKESKMIGGETRALYMIGPVDTVYENKPYAVKGGSPWGTGNAYAKVMGIETVSCNVIPEKRGKGYCAKLETTLKVVTAIGIDMKAVAAGSMFTGKLADPMTSEGTKNPAKAINMGMKFTKRPKALMLDYKAKISSSNELMQANASTKVKKLQGHDEGEIILFLQHRWEDENGRIFAYRVGTASKHLSETTPDWQNNQRIPVRYGDISGEAQSWEKLTDKRFMAKNSKGKMVYIEEVGYRDDVEPTHMILQITSGSKEPFVGCPGNTVWVDNIRLVY
ncbi:MAG: PCMD domain-containing protein [Paludibacteraceae bacterium]|nr:PCMD domain-containing protein [Paludibacteraceae bacterium]